MEEVKINGQTSEDQQKDVNNKSDSSADYRNETITKGILLDEKEKWKEKLQKVEEELKLKQELLESANEQLKLVANKKEDEFLKSQGVIDPKSLRKLAGEVKESNIDKVRVEFPYLFKSKEKFKGGVKATTTNVSQKRTFQEATKGLNQDQILSNWQNLKKEFNLK